MKKTILKNIVVVAVAILTTIGAASCKKDSTTSSASSKQKCVCSNGESKTLANQNNAASAGECELFQNYQTGVLGNAGTTCSIK